MISSPSTATSGVSAIKILLFSTTSSSSAISSIIIIVRATMGRISSTRVGWSSRVIWTRRTSHTSRGHSRCKHSLVGSLAWHHLLTHLRMETWSWSCLRVHHGPSTARTRRWVVTWITTRGDTAKSWLGHVLWWLLLLLLLTSFGRLASCGRGFSASFLLSRRLWATLLRRRRHSSVRRPRILLRHWHRHWQHTLHWWSSRNKLRSAHHRCRYMCRNRCRNRSRWCKCFCPGVESEFLGIGIEFCVLWFVFLLFFFFVALFRLFNIVIFRFFLCFSFLFFSRHLELRNIWSDWSSLGFFHNRRCTLSIPLLCRRSCPTHLGGSRLLPRLLFPCSLILPRFIQYARIQVFLIKVQCQFLITFLSQVNIRRGLTFNLTSNALRVFDFGLINLVFIKFCGI
mmetsp:Transcript_30629/g.48002  ORF Transcript_30629/g.48002 Transcript_30629/m.48002 type:complete len:398 (+) Transcript_30629:212-1405(+)